MAIEVTGLKDALITSFKDKSSTLLESLDPQQLELVQRQLMAYAELELLLMAAKYDTTIDVAQVNTDIGHVYASLSALGEVAALKAKAVIKEIAWDVFKAVLKMAITALI